MPIQIILASGETVLIDEAHGPTIAAIQYGLDRGVPHFSAPSGTGLSHQGGPFLGTLYPADALHPSDHIVSAGTAMSSRAFAVKDVVEVD